MTWQKGKRPEEPTVPSQFAPLAPLLAEHQQQPEESFKMMAQALGSYDTPVLIHIRLLHDEKVEHWEVQGGTAAPAVQQHEPQEADVIVIVRRETWVQIAQGRLSPVEALLSGKLRVGGDQEEAKRLARHLSDPAVPFVSPC